MRRAVVIGDIWGNGRRDASDYPLIVLKSVGVEIVPNPYPSDPSWSYISGFWSIWDGTRSAFDTSGADEYKIKEEV